MKTMNVKGMGFGFSAVNAGQRNVVTEPQVIAVSTEGSFRITPQVSKVLNVANGEYMMFLSNVDNIDVAIREKSPEVVEFCEKEGLEVGSVEAAIAIHKEFDMWAIAKGIKEYDAKGNLKTVSERLTKKDKERYVAQNFDAMLTAAMQDADDDVKAALTRDGITEEEQKDILTAFVTPRELPKYKGSKLFNPAGLSGTGVSLTFTDNNVWKQMKYDMGEDAGKYNRIFDVDVDNLQDIELDNGFETVVVKALILGSYVDKEVTRRGEDEEAAAE